MNYVVLHLSFPAGISFLVLPCIFRIEKHIQLVRKAVSCLSYHLARQVKAVNGPFGIKVSPFLTFSLTGRLATAASCAQS